MDKWEQRINSTGVIERFEELALYLADLHSTEESEEADVRRLERIVRLAGHVLATADAVVAPESALVSLEQQAIALRSNLDTWSSGATPSALGGAMGTAESMVLQLPALRTATSVSEAADVVVAFRRSVGQYRSNIERELTEVVDTARGTATTLEAQVTEMLANVDRLRAQVGQLEAQAADTLNRQQNVFAEAQDQRSVAFSSQLDGMIESFRSDQSERTTTMALFIDDFKLRSSEQLSEADAHAAATLAHASSSNERIDEILGLVGEKALIGEYAQTAARERKVADRLRAFAIVALLGAVAVGVWAAWHAVTGNWHAFAGKGLLGLTITGLVLYLIRQSGEHREAERDARHVGLQLTALKPYLHDLTDDNDRDDVLKGVADRLFGQPRPTHGGSATESPLPAGQLLDLLVQILQRTSK